MVDGNYEVLNNIYKDQLGLEDVDFQERLHLVYGDQKTYSLSLSCRARYTYKSSKEILTITFCPVIHASVAHRRDIRS